MLSSRETDGQDGITSTMKFVECTYSEVSPSDGSVSDLAFLDS